MLKHFSIFLLVLVVASGSAQSPKRPMTFEDMMAMKRLGDTAVSSDGKWLAYSVTSVDLEKNTRTPELWLQKIEGGEPMKVAVGQPGDGGLEFAPDGHSVLFLSGRDGSQQVWLADFDAATGATSNAKKLTSITTEADNAKWSPDGKSIVFTSAVYPDCAPITIADAAAGNKCNADRDAAAAASKVKAQIFTHLLYRHWNHFTGDKRSPSVYCFARRRGAPRPESRRSPRCSAVLARRRRRLFHLTRFEGTGVHGEPRSRAGDLNERRYFHPRPDQSRGKAREDQQFAGRGFRSGVLA